MHASALCRPSLQCLPVACPVGAVTMLTACRCHYIASSSAFNDMKRCCVAAPQTFISILMSHRTASSLSIFAYVLYLGELPVVVSAQKLLRYQTNDMANPVQNLKHCSTRPACVVNHSSVSGLKTVSTCSPRCQSKQDEKHFECRLASHVSPFLARDILSHIVCIYYFV
jgi:hypothetical protein